MKKLVPVAGLLLSAGLLTACHENPLTTHSETQSSRFLLKASVEAAKSLKLNLRTPVAAQLYSNCMDDRVKVFDKDDKAFSVPCAKVFQAMVHYAHTGAFPGFESTSLADLTNKVVFKDLRDEYELRVSVEDWEG